MIDQGKGHKIPTWLSTCRVNYTKEEENRKCNCQIILIQKYYKE